MPRVLGVCCLLGIFGPAAFADRVSPVQKVIELLDNLKAKVQGDLDAEAASMEEYTTWCDDSISDKGYAIKTANREIADLKATIADATASISELDSVVEDTTVAISKKEKSLSGAAAVRIATSKDFAATEKELVDTVDELAGARVQLKRQGLGLLQASSGGGKKEAAAEEKIKEIEEALAGIVNSARIQQLKTKTLQGFVQASEGDDLTLKQPQGSVEQYSGHSSGISGTVEDMQAKAEASLSEARKGEMKSKHEFDMMQMTLEQEIKHLKKALARAISEKATAGQDKAKAGADLAQVEKAKAADEKVKSGTELECRAKADEWAERQHEAGEEMGAIAKAKEILSTGVKALVQMGARVRQVGSAEEDLSIAAAAKRTRLVKKLTGLSQKFHSFNLMQIASTAGADPFGKIRGMIEDMIEKLLNEANEEATHKAFCDEELAKSNKAKNEKFMKMDKYQARMDKAQTSAAELEAAVKNLQSEVAKLDSELKAAAEIRNKEHEEFLTASKDFGDSQRAVAAAIAVLRDYYSGAFIQVKAASARKAGAKQPDFGSAQKDSSGSIISIMEVAESDFARLLAQAENDENVAARSFEELNQETKLSRAAKLAEQEGKASEIKSLNVGLLHYKEDHSIVGKELDAVMEYLEKLKPECTTKTMSYEERKALREQEVEGLKEALAILAGEDVAAPTSSLF